MGILMVMTYTIVANKILLMGSGQVQFMIFSLKYREITEALIKVDFGGREIGRASCRERV